MNSSRARLWITATGLLGYITLAAGSGAAAAGPVTIAEIVQAYRAVRTMLVIVKAVSSLATASVDSAYSDLPIRLRTDRLSVSSIQEMENTYAVLRHNADSLRTALTGTENNADRFFGLLTRRAKENTTPDLRDSMLRDIEAKQDEFGERLGTAKRALEEVDRSVQKYNDILGYVQVKAGLETIDRYQDEIERIIEQARMLNVQVQAAITESESIVGSLNVPDES